MVAVDGGSMPGTGRTRCVTGDVATTARAAVPLAVSGVSRVAVRVVGAWAVAAAARSRTHEFGHG
jgi:hypothetical protein